MTGGPARALVLAAAPVAPDDRLRGIAQACEIAVAADGGLAHAEALGVTPEAVVGDFDSAAEALLGRYPDVRRERYPAAKDTLDLELAIEAALARGARSLAIMGALGGRLDQTLAAILISARQRRQGVDVVLHGNDVDVAPLASGHAARPAVEAGTRFSILALEGPAIVSITGARYPLERETVAFGIGLGLSNVATEGLEVTCHDGTIALIVTHASEEEIP